MGQQEVLSAGPSSIIIIIELPALFVFTEGCVERPIQDNVLNSHGNEKTFRRNWTSAPIITALMTGGHILTSQIFDAYTNKFMFSVAYAMPDSGIPGKRAFDTVVMGENQQLMSKIMVPPRPEEFKNGTLEDVLGVNCKHQKCSLNRRSAGLMIAG